MLNFLKKKKKEVDKQDMDFLGDLKYQVLGTQGIFDKLSEHDRYFQLIEDEINNINDRMSRIEKNIDDIKNLFRFHQKIIFKEGEVHGQERREMSYDKKMPKM